MNQRLLTLAATALLACGCVNDSPLYVTGLFSLDPDRTGACTATPGTVSQYAGGLDLSGSPNYQLIAVLQSQLEDVSTVAAGGTLITGQQRNTVILDTINFTYTSAPTTTVASVTYEAESLPITIVVAPGSTQNIRLNSLLGPKAFEKLNTAVVNAGDTSDLRVKFDFSGNINSGGRIRSTPITYPITVYRSGTTCASGSFCKTGPCGTIGGQDGNPLVCPTPSTDGGMPACPTTL